MIDETIPKYLRTLVPDKYLKTMRPKRGSTNAKILHQKRIEAVRGLIESELEADFYWDLRDADPQPRLNGYRNTQEVAEKILNRLGFARPADKKHREETA